MNTSNKSHTVKTFICCVLLLAIFPILLILALLKTIFCEICDVINYFNKLKEKYGKEEFKDEETELTIEEMEDYERNN